MRYRGPFWWFWQDDAAPIPIWTPRAGVFLLWYPCCTTVGPVRRKGQAEGSACSPPPHSLSRLSSTQARSGLGGAQGSICHRSLAVWPGAPGEGAQSEACAGVRGLRCPSCGFGPSSATPSSPSGPGKVPGIQPLPPSPALGRPGPHDALAASPQWSPEPVLNLNDSCPQPSQLQLISEGFQGPG